MRRRLILAVACIALVGCSLGQSAQPPAATAIPWDPNLLTESRQAVADRWSRDVARRAYVRTYMDAICAPDGQWAQMSGAWAKDQEALWGVLWRFQPIPNQSPSSPIPSDAIASLLSLAVKAAPLLAARAGAVPTGLPPC